MRTRLTGIRSIIAVIIILALTGLASAQETVQLETLPVLASGASTANLFDADVTTRLYAFQASAGDNVTITMTQQGDELDPFVILLDATGAVLAVDDDSGSTFLSAQITDFAIADDGTYFVLATSLLYIEDGGYSVTDEQDYTLTIAGQTTPDNFDPARIEVPLEMLQYGAVIDGESTVDAPAALFAFEGTAGDVVDILVQSDEFPTAVHVFDPTGARLDVDPSAITSLELPEDGIYLILATDVFFYEALQDDGFFLGGAFTLSLNG